LVDGRLALIIACSQYEDSVLEKLEGIPQQAKALARVLEDPKIGNFNVKTLLNESSNNVRNEILTLLEGLRRSDLLLIYLACHGIKDVDGQLYFAMVDTQIKRLDSTAISANFVNDVMSRSPSSQQVLLLDCVYSGAFSKGIIPR